MLFATMVTESAHSKQKPPIRLVLVDFQHAAAMAAVEHQLHLDLRQTQVPLLLVSTGVLLPCGRTHDYGVFRGHESCWRSGQGDGFARRHVE